MDHRDMKKNDIIQASSLDPIIEAILFEKLIKGRDLANKLLQLVSYHHGISNNIIIANEENDLVNDILGSFTNTLFLLNHTYNSNLVSLRDSSSSSSSPFHHAYPKSHPHDDKELEDQSYKSLTNRRNQRGRYKRKRNVESWENDSPILAEDGYAWRKYGQKMTTNAKYIRNYYRCSHKYEEGCSAMKYVQRIQQNPSLYRTTYFGLHTCKTTNTIANYHIVPQEYPNYDHYPSTLISFNNSDNSNNTLPISTKQEHLHQPFVFSSSSSSSSSMNKLEDHNIVESFGVNDIILRCFEEFDEFEHFGL